jgi:hypothetical protein
MKRLKAIITVVLLGSTLFLTPLTKVKAASDFEFNTSFNLNYKPGDTFITVTEELEVVVNNPKYIFPAGGSHKMYLPDFSIDPEVEERKFKKESLRIEDFRGIERGYEITDEVGRMIVDIPIVSSIEYGDTYKITMSYNTHQLLSINGAITNLYIPALNEETIFQKVDEKGLVTSYNFTTTLTTTTATKSPSYIQPNTISKEIKGEKVTYTVDQRARLGQTSWLQLGSDQYYYFKMVQVAPKTDEVTPEGLSDIIPITSTNIFKLALPREFDETQQKAFFTRIDPKPTEITRDVEGNIIATFEVPANKDTEIVIEGYITLYKPPITTSDVVIPDINLSEYRDEIAKQDFSKYVQADTYWEVDDPVIKEIANELLSQASSIEDLINVDYMYIVDNFDYSYEKASGENKRLGAKAALTGSQSICMEYADSLIALLRAQGIPARAALGYGNDPTGAENKISNDEPLIQRIGHQWVQVWLPDYGWLSVDPTWGESDRLYIGSDLDHILWYTVGDEDQLIADTLLYSADQGANTKVSNFTLYLQALDEDMTEGSDTIDQLLIDYKEGGSGNLGLFLKTTPLGRGLLIAAPLLSLVAAVITILTGGTALFRYFSRKESSRKE